MQTRKERTGVALEPDKLRARASENRSIVGWVMGFWVVAAIGYGFWLKIKYDLSGPFSCPIPGKESSWGTARWQWLPPGDVCSYPGTDFPTTYPRPAGAVIGGFLILVPIVIMPLWIWSEVRIRNLLTMSSRGG
jgi:hypothetical protein